MFSAIFEVNKQTSFICLIDTIYLPSISQSAQWSHSIRLILLSSIRLFDKLSKLIHRLFSLGLKNWVKISIYLY